MNIYFEDIFQRRIRLSDERKSHLEEEHPELKNIMNKLEETLSNPDIIVKSNIDKDAELFYKWYTDTSAGNKYLCAVLVEKILTNDIFILTAYFTNSIKKGEILWKKK